MPRRQAAPRAKRRVGTRQGRAVRGTPGLPGNVKRHNAIADKLLDNNLIPNLVGRKKKTGERKSEGEPFYKS